VNAHQVVTPSHFELERLFKVDPPTLCPDLVVGLGGCYELSVEEQPPHVAPAPRRPRGRPGVGQFRQASRVNYCYCAACEVLFVVRHGTLTRHHFPRERVKRRKES
jgi:hypothetical protein